MFSLRSKPESARSASAVTFLIVACAHPKPEIDKLPDSTLSFSPAMTELDRFVSNCGESNPSSIPWPRSD